MALTATNSREEDGKLVLSLPENQGAGTVVSTLGTDEESESIHSVVLFGDDLALFSINAAHQVVFKGTAQDFEAMPENYVLRLLVVTIDSETKVPTTHWLDVQVEVTDVDESPTGLVVQSVVAELIEGTYASGKKLADITIVDDALGTNTLSALPEDGPFEYRNADRTGAELWLKAGAVLDREEVDSITANVSVEGTTLTATHTLRVLDVNDTAPTLIQGGTQATLEEGTYAAETDTGIRYTVQDPDLNDTHSFVVSDQRFDIRQSDGALLIKAGSKFDHEAHAGGIVSVLVEVKDAGGNKASDYALVRLKDLNDTAPVFQGSGNVLIDENSGAAQLVYDPSVVPDVAGDSVTHSLSGPDAASFTFDAATGELTLTGDPDYESKSVYLVTITAETRAGQPDARSASQNVIVRVRDLNDEAPHFDTTAVAEIAEGTGAGQLVHTPRAAVPDIIGDVVTYTLGGTDASAFTINASTGALTLVGDPDFESKPYYSVTISAVTRDGADDEQSAEQSFTLLVLDRPGDELTLEVKGVQTTLSEGVHAEGADTGYDISVAGLDGISGITLQVDDARFFVKSDGTLAVKEGAEFDYEQAQSVTISISASDGQGKRGSAEVTVNIANLNDTAPDILSSPTGHAITENDDLAKGTQVYQAAGSYDVQPIEWHIKDGDSSLFEIDSSSGAVTLVKALTPDHEVKSEYTFTLVADSGSLTTEQAVSLPVTDLNDTGPEFDQASKAISVDENSGAGQLLHTAVATPDVNGDTVAYALSGADAALFTIDAATGELRLTGDPDYETKNLYQINITAVTRDGRADEQSAAQEIQVVVENLDDNAPELARSGVQVDLSEGSYADSTATGHTFTATDADGIGPLAFSVDDSRFEVLQDGSLAISAGSELDYEALEEGILTVVVTVTDPAGQTDSESVDLVISDVDENPLTITSAATATAIDENAEVAATHVVYSAESSGGEVVVWRLKGADAAKFQIGANSGEVSFSKATTPDHEAKASYVFTIMAESAGKMTELEVVLPVNDLNDTPPTFAATGAAEVSENSGAGQVVYTPVSAVPDVAGDNVTYQLAGADAELFELDSGTGALTLIGNPDHEAKSSYSVTIHAVTRAGLADERSASQAVTVTVTNVIGTAPDLQRGGQQTALNEGTFNAVTATGYSYQIEDPDAGESHAFKVSDSRFAVKEVDDVLTLVILNGKSFDFEKGDGSLSVKVTVTDSEGNTDDDTVIVRFSDVDEAPVLARSGAARSLNEGTFETATVTGYTYALESPDAGDSHTFTVSDNRFEIVGASNALRIKAGKSFDFEKGDASVSVKVTVTDRAGNADDDTVTIRFSDVDEAPVLARSGTPQSLSEGTFSTATATGYTYALESPDAGDSHAFTVSDSRFEIVGPTNALRIKSGESFDFEKGDASVSVKVKVTDGAGNTDEDTVTIRFLDVDEAPVLARSGTPQSLSEGTFANATATGYTYALECPDAGDTHTFTVSDSRFEIVGPTNALRIKSGESFDFEKGDASVSVKVTVTDRAGNTDDDTVTIRFSDVDEAPVLARSGTPQSLSEGTFATATATGYSYGLECPDARDTHTFTVNDSRFEIVGTHNVLKIKAGESFDFEKGDASVSVKVKVTDGAGNTDEDTVTISFSDMDEAPVLARSGTSPSLSEGTYANATATGYTYELECPDAGDTHTLTVNDSRFEIVGASNALRIKAGQSFDFEKGDASVSVKVTVTDRAGSNDDDTVTIRFSDVDEAPVLARSGTLPSLSEGTYANATVTGYTYELECPDADDTHTFTVSDGRFEIVGASNSLRIKSGESFDFEKGDASVSVKVTVTDRAGNTDDDTVTIRFSDVDEAPVLAMEDSQISLDEGTYASATATGYTFVLECPDVGDTHTFTVSDDRFEISGDNNALTIREGQLFDHESGDDEVEVTVTVSDNGPNGYTDSKTVTVVFNDTNDVPPEITSGTAGMSFEEGSPISKGTLVYAATGTYDTIAITWSVVAPSQEKQEKQFPFTITSGGQVSFSDTITPDHEKKSAYTFTLVATSDDLVTSELITINIIDKNDEKPTFENQSIDLNENATGRSLTFDVTSAVPDVEGDTVDYELDSESKKLFDLSVEDGQVELTLKEVPDHEGNSSYSASIKAVTRKDKTDEQSKAATVVLNIVDLNDEAPEIQVPSKVFKPGLSWSTGPVFVTTAIGTADVQGDSVVWSLKGTHARYFEIRDNGEIWTRADVSPSNFDHFLVIQVVATVGELSSESTVGIRRGPIRITEESSKEKEDADGDESAGDSSEDSGDGEDGGSGDHAAAASLAYDDGMF